MDPEMELFHQEWKCLFMTSFSEQDSYQKEMKNVFDSFKEAFGIIKEN